MMVDHVPSFVFRRGDGHADEGQIIEKPQFFRLGAQGLFGGFVHGNIVVSSVVFDKPGFVSLLEQREHG
ncbi:MAG: hypothetical protein HQL99_14690 [Magnetococcales bacterium]|nr:hypothetical protein [Magnetococcales bacterium]